MRVIVTGAEGLLGTELKDALGLTHQVVPLSRRDLDITGPDVTPTLRLSQPYLVVHAAAYTDVDGCEKDPARALRVNAEGTRRVAQACRELKVPLVYFSTDYVFDGSKGRPYHEEDAVNPLAVYARSKWEGEQQVRRTLEEYFIVRTSWLYGRTGRSFVRSVLTQAKANKPLQVVDDQVGSPTWAADLARAVGRLIEKAPFGLYHLTNSGYCSWFEFAQAILTDAGLSRVPLSRISSRQLDRPAPRPAYSVLDNRAWLSLFDEPLPHWRKALQTFLQQGEVGL
ncbi:MAG: dTDP-4-dehydrorhamnose reductase [Candidatus Methylomirabilales bacterium]